MGKAFAWCILVLTFAYVYEVFVRKALRDPTAWAFDISYTMYGALFMMAGAYCLSRDAHVRGDVIYRLWPARVQAVIELTLIILFLELPALGSGWTTGGDQHQQPRRRTGVSVEDASSDRRILGAAAGDCGSGALRVVSEAW
jgi:hypothetical protein